MKQRLDKDNCLGARLNHEDLAGIKLNGEYIYETTGPDHLNIYTLRIPSGRIVQATLWDEDDGSLHYENNYYPYIDWGEGQPIIDKSGNRKFTHNYSAYAELGQSYSIRTTCTLLTDDYYDVEPPGKYIVDIVSVRTDHLHGNNLFMGYSGVKTIREPVLEKLNTSKFTGMSSMFEGCTSLEKLNLSSFDTSNVEGMNNMFRDCKKLRTLDLSNFDTSKVWDVNGMFLDCTSLTELNLSNFNLDSINPKGYGMANFLGNCNSLHTLHLDNCNYDTINKILTCYGGTHSFPTGTIDGVTRIIYCKKENTAGLVEPEGWKFSHID